MSEFGSKLGKTMSGEATRKRKWTDEETVGGVKDEISTPVIYIRNGKRGRTRHTCEAGKVQSGKEVSCRGCREVGGELKDVEQGFRR
jgi:hypothetical protein